ncbi:hypothetical protein PIB30_080789, partial [Stylosanthes scabra]|nr:hypothetical protein [Stylosanthes scabra]
ALIFRYMLAGAAVPPELLQPIKKSLFHSSPYFLHHSLQHYQPAARKFLLLSSPTTRVLSDGGKPPLNGSVNVTLGGGFAAVLP